MKRVARHDYGSVKGDSKRTEEGYLRANAIVTRTGVFTYRNADGSVRRELRHPEDVWSPESVASLEMIPVTNGHPTEKMVNSENFKRLSIGYTGQKIYADGEHVMANFVINDITALDHVLNHGRQQLSLGYTVELDETPGIWNGEAYDARQRNIKYNHLAIVEKARAGEQAKIILDSEDAIITDEEVQIMTKVKIKIDNEEVSVEEKTAAYLDRLHEDMKNLSAERGRVEAKMKDSQDELTRVNSELAMIRDKLEKAEGERDSMKDSMKDKEGDKTYDSVEFHRAVKARSQLNKVAETHLDSETVAKLDSMSDLDIKKTIIQKVKASINLDGKSESYIDGVFETLIDEKSKKVNLDGVKFNQKNLDSVKTSDKARDEMIERQRNGYKQSTEQK